MLFNSANTQKGGFMPIIQPTLEDAVILAATLHRGQVDKQGEPYILHALRVMLRLRTEQGRIVGVLHDTKEDCGVTDELLRRLGYGEEVIEALDYLTKRPEEEKDYEAFIHRVKSGPALAVEVKLADLEDNSDPSRIPNPTEWDLKRNEKYHKAKAFLQKK